MWVSLNQLGKHLDSKHFFIGHMACLCFCPVHLITFHKGMPKILVSKKRHASYFNYQSNMWEERPNIGQPIVFITSTYVRCGRQQTAHNMCLSTGSLTMVIFNLNTMPNKVINLIKNFKNAVASNKTLVNQKAVILSHFFAFWTIFCQKNEKLKLYLNYRFISKCA